MGASVEPEKTYSPDNPFVGKQYSPDNPFAKPSAPHNPTKLEIARRNASEPHPEDMEDDGPPSAQTKILGVIAALNRDIPGAEAVQAGIRSMNSARVSGKANRFGFIPTERTQSYTEARNDIRGAEDAAPWQATLPARLLGAGISAATIPGGPILQGARFGALSGLAQSDPTLSAGDRIRSGGEGAAVGALAGSIFPAAKAAGGTVAGTYRTVKDVAGLLHGNPAAAIRLGRRASSGIRQFLQEASKVAPEAAPAVEATAPNSGGSAVEVFQKATRQRHRTAAQFQHIAERMGREPPKPQTLDGQLHGVLNKARASQPEEVGSTVGDAEEAQGLAPDQEPDLEALLRASLAAVRARTLR